MQLQPRPMTRPSHYYVTRFSRDNAPIVAVITPDDRCFTVRISTHDALPLWSPGAIDALPGEIIEHAERTLH